MKNRKGFTLAEVLVTLAVIGVVAALTIPALIQSSNTKQFTTGLKKAVSVLNQALTMSIAENGTDAATCNNCANTAGLMSLFQTNLSVIANTSSSLTTADGMIYTFYKPDTTACGNSTSTSDPATAKCIVEVDVNGAKGSSVASHMTPTTHSDIYYLVIKASQVVPANAGTGWNPKAISGFRVSAAPTTDIADIAIQAVTN
jgi:prepilin-type N-terminal cleavage/methylation domain-containing protein